MAVHRILGPGFPSTSSGQALRPAQDKPGGRLPEGIGVRTRKIYDNDRKRGEMGRG